MALHTEISVTIGGTEIKTFDQLFITQAINQHHYFELHCRGDAFLKLGGDIREQFNGKDIFFMIQAIGKFQCYMPGVFKGIVDHVAESKSELTSNNTIIIRGKSPTTLLDDGAHCCSYTDKSLKQIVDEVLQRGVQQNLLKSEVKPVSKQKLPYIVQYEEGGFQFISRMAARMGEWCYYDGEQLVFGQGQPKELPLKYGDDLTSYSIETRLRPAKSNYMANDFVNDKYEEKATTQLQAGMGSYNKMTLDESESAYMHETIQLSQIAFSEGNYKSELEAAVKVEKAGRVADMVVVQGKSDNPGVCLGSIVNIQDGMTSYGKFIITKVSHQGTGLGDYQNTFEGISVECEAPPYTSINALPRADKQVAKVTDNNDPKGLGRIRAKFPWQKKGEKTPWMRIATPHAGSDKGFHFLPEKDEEVLIDFEGKNAEKPFMLATFYHGKAKPDSWKTDKNNIKAIKTRSGHTIKLDDTDGKESITILDKSGNTITLDTKGASISISAPEKITLSAKDIALNASNSINMAAQPGESGGKGTIDMSAKSNIGTKSDEGNISIDAATGTMTIHSTALMNIKTDAGMSISSTGAMSVSSSGVMTITGGPSAFISSGDTNIM